MLREGRPSWGIDFYFILSYKIHILLSTVGLVNGLVDLICIFPFLDIPYLRELALNNNPLQRIEGHAFEMVPQIVSLDVSGKLRLPTLILITILNHRLSNKEDLGEGISQHSRAGEAAAAQQQDRGDQAEDGGQSGGSPQSESSRQSLAMWLWPQTAHLLADGGEPPHGGPAQVQEPHQTLRWEVRWRDSGQLRLHPRGPLISDIFGGKCWWVVFLAVLSDSTSKDHRLRPEYYLRRVCLCLLQQTWSLHHGDRRITLKTSNDNIKFYFPQNWDPSVELSCWTLFLVWSVKLQRINFL